MNTHKIKRAENCKKRKSVKKNQNRKKLSWSTTARKRERRTYERVNGSVCNATTRGYRRQQRPASAKRVAVMSVSRRHRAIATTTVAAAAATTTTPTTATNAPPPPPSRASRIIIIIIIYVYTRTYTYTRCAAWRRGYPFPPPHPRQGRH